MSGGNIIKFKTVTFQGSNSKTTKVATSLKVSSLEFVDLLLVMLLCETCTCDQVHVRRSLCTENIYFLSYCVTVCLAWVMNDTM